MNEGAKMKFKQATQELMKSISSMSGQDFESFGYIILEVIVKQKLIHKGQKANGQPVGYTTDVYSADGTIVGEFSIENDYFNDRRTKPSKDINHAVNLHPQVNTIHLFSNQEASSTEGKDFANWISSEQKRLNITIKWYDSKIIADFIVNNFINNPFNLSKIKRYISDSAFISLESLVTPYSIQLPENYFGDYLEPYNLLKDNKIIYISGPSGIGKTTLAKKIIKELLKNTFIDYYYTADNIDENGLIPHDLCGGKINLYNWFQNHKYTVAFLDDIEQVPDNFYNNICNYLSNNYIVITSIYKPPEFLQDYIFNCEVPSIDNSKKILNYKLPNPCNDQSLLNNILEKTSRYPLVLEIIRKYIRDNSEETWQNIVDDIQDLEDDNHTLITSRIIKKHGAKLECNELESLKWLDKQIICYDVLKALIKSVNINKLIKRSIIKKKDNLIYVHNIILESIKSSIQISEKQNNIFKNKFYDFLDSNTKNADFYISLHLHKNIIDKLYNGVKNSEDNDRELYYYICANKTGCYDKLDKINISKILSFIKSSNDKAGYALKSLVELYEAKLISISKDERTSVINESIHTLLNIVMYYEESEKLTAYINHHLGKQYLKNKDLDNAENYLNMALKDNKPYETLLQYARLKRRQGKFEDYYTTISTILDAYNNEEQISISIVLSAYEELKNCTEEMKNKYLIENFENFKCAFSSIIADDYERPYRVLSSLANTLVFNYSKEYVKLFELLQMQDISTIPLKSHFAYAQLYKSAGKASFGNYKKCYETAKSFYISYYRKGLMKDSEYYLTQYMDFLQCSGVDEYSEALKIYESNSIIHDTYFGEYRVGKSYYELNDYQNAISHLRIAEEILDKDSNYSKYSGSLYHLIALCLQNLEKDKSEIDHYFQLALDKEKDNPKYLDIIKKDYNKFINEDNN